MAGTQGFTPRGYAQGGPPPARTQAALDRLERERGKVRVRLDRESGAVRSLRGRLRSAPPAEARRTAQAFLSEYADLFGIADPATELIIRGVDQDRNGYQSIRFEQHVGAARVLGADLRLDLDASGLLYAAHGMLLPSVNPPASRPRIPAERAVELAHQSLSVPGRLASPAELVVVRQGPTDHLAWRVMLNTGEPARWEIWVDALTGHVLRRRNRLTTAKWRRTYSAGKTWSLPGTLVRDEGDLAVGDPHADAAHDHTGRVYDYFRATYGRDSLDGAGMPLQSTVHYGQNENNAFWDGVQTAYGDGDGILFGPLGTALDIVAHELTHGITEFTAGLVYQDESGALNEAYSDIFAALIDDANWEIGEQVYTPGIPGDALRSLADPTRYDQPSVWGEYLEMTTDFGGVHVNNGILNHIAYRIAQKIGRPKLGLIFYRTLTMKLTQQSDHEDVREQTLAACNEMIGTAGITPDDCRIVQSVFAGAGLGEYPQLAGDFRHRVFLPRVASGADQCGANVIQNGTFEAGSAKWPNTGNVIGLWQGDDEGNQSARLAGGAQLLQLLQLPPQAGRILLSFDLFRQNSSPMRLRVDVEEPATRAAVAPSAHVDEGVASGAWQRITLTLDRSVMTSTNRLVFRKSPTSGAPGAIVYVDSVEARAVCGP